MVAVEMLMRAQAVERVVPVVVVVRMEGPVSAMRMLGVRVAAEADDEMRAARLDRQRDENRKGGPQRSRDARNGHGAFGRETHARSRWLTP
jgi:hypothetical protein